MTKSILLGYEYDFFHDKQDISIDIGELLYNVEIYGMIGRGKTRLVSNIIQQLFRNRIPTLIFDIKGEYATTFAAEPNVEIFTVGLPHPLCINLFDTKDEDDVRGTLLIIEEMMTSSNQEFSPSMKNLFETALFLTHKEETRTLETFVEILIDLAKKTKHITTIQHTLDAVLNRINYIFNPTCFEILGVAETTLNFGVLEQKKSIIFDLSQFQRRAARPSDIYLVCNLILKLFYRYASSKELTNKLRYVVVLEEAINIIPKLFRKTSSASLITAENNFLLGRSLGIGHITISQMWESVSDIVHGNSSTKIVFRSNQDIDQIAKTFNFEEEHYSRLKQLPIRHCFFWKDGQKEVAELITADFNLIPLRYNGYLIFLRRKYSSTTYPLLFNSFIDMRAKLFDKLSNTKQSTKKKKAKVVAVNQKPKSSSSDTEESKLKSRPTIKISYSEKQYSSDDVCFTFCSLSKDSEKCTKIRKDADKISSLLVMSFTKDEIEQAILGTSNQTLGKLLQKVALNHKLPYNKQITFCAKRKLTNFLLEKSCHKISLGFLG